MTEGDREYCLRMFPGRPDLAARCLWHIEMGLDAEYPFPNPDPKPVGRLRRLLWR